MEILTPEQQKTKDGLTAFVQALDNNGDGLNSPVDIVKGVNNNKSITVDDNVDDKSKDNQQVDDTTKDVVDVNKDNQQQADNTADDNTDSDEEELTVVDHIKNTFELDFKDEQGQDIVFENSFEGIADFVTKSSEVLAQKKIDTILETKPEAKAFYEHILAGGDVDSFKNSYIPDFGSVTLNKDNVDQLKNMYTQSLVAKGFQDSDIKDLLEVAETKGSLLDKATQGQKELVKYREDFFAQQTKAKEVAEIKAKEESEQIQKEVKTILGNGKLLGIQVDKKTSDDLLNYITKPVKNGYTQFEIDKNTKEKYTTEHELFEAYQLMKGYQGILPKTVEKVKDVVKNSIPTKKTGSIPTSGSGKMTQKDAGKMPTISMSDRDRLLN
jgi:hypothetical protein